MWGSVEFIFIDWVYVFEYGQYYLNVCAFLAEDIEKEDTGSICLMYNSDILDLYAIRQNIKQLSNKLRIQLDTKFQGDEH